MSIREMKVGENIVSVSEAKAYMAKVLEIVEWGMRPYYDVQTYQRRHGGVVCEEGIVIEFYMDDGSGITQKANIHYYVRTQPDANDDGLACLRFGRDCGKYGYESSDLPFYGTAEDAADFLCGWLEEREREDEDADFHLTKEQENDGYVPHELSVSARKRMQENVLAAARRYAVQAAKARRECERENAKRAKAKAKVAKKTAKSDLKIAV